MLQNLFFYAEQIKNQDIYKAFDLFIDIPCNMG